MWELHGAPRNYVSINPHLENVSASESWSTWLSRPVTCMTLSCHMRGLLQPLPCGQEMMTGEVMFAGTVSSDAQPGLITHTVEMKYNPDTCTILHYSEPFHFSVSDLMLSHMAPCHRWDSIAWRPAGLFALCPLVVLALLKQDTNMALCCADGQSIFLLLLCQSIMHNLKSIYKITRNSHVTLKKTCRTWQNQMKLKWKIPFNCSLYDQMQ